ncbi:MAG: MATE family efflux transporter [Clostridia bacterium]|nr:MATE family efflux transporter [Clostridia bacterium]
MGKEENILGTEKVGKLIKKFSIPCIISMVVNSLYNIVDQIFVGQGVGYLGNGATNIIFPLTVVAMSIALMIGDGTSAFLNLKLGEKKEKEAGKGVANGIALSSIISILLSTICLIFLPILINLFGCTEDIRPHALDYGYIILIGFPFMTIGTVLNGLIRADGSPKYAMVSMILGAVLNTVLDPIFIFILGWGVKGAALATILSQLITAILNICYIRKFKSVKFSKDMFKIDRKISLKLCALGISSFINQISIVILIAVENNMLKMAGANSKFGPNIPITVLGIVIKISQILTSIIIGIAVGSQPIMGFNYGARKFDRVKKALKYVVGIGTGVSIVAFILFQTIPDKLISIFGSGDELYTEFACIAFRRYLMLCIVYGIEFPAGIFFQAIGKSTKSAVISLSRQLLFLVPTMIILGYAFGIDGLLYSGPVADILGTIICVVLIGFEIKALNKLSKSNETNTESTFENKVENNKISDNSNHIVITISREYGSGGRYIAQLLAKKLGIKLYDKELIEKVKEETGYSKDYIEQNEQKRVGTDFINDNAITNEDELFNAEFSIINDLYEKESCIIVGRCADYILKDKKDVINVFVYSSTENKIKRAINYYNIKEKDAQKTIKQINKQRANHYKHYTQRQWGNPENYDICINSDYLGIEKSVDIIAEMLSHKTAVL